MNNFPEESKKHFDEKFRPLNMGYAPAREQHHAMLDFLASEIQRFADEAIERMEKEKRYSKGKDAFGNLSPVTEDWFRNETISKAQEILNKMKS